MKVNVEATVIRQIEVATIIYIKRLMTEAEVEYI